MRILIVGLPKVPTPLEELSQLLDSERNWYERYRDRVEMHGWFVGGGGFVIVNVEDEVTLNQIVGSIPSRPSPKFRSSPSWTTTPACVNSSS